MSSASFSLDSKTLSCFWYNFSVALVCFSNSLVNAEYSHFLIATAFFSKFFSGKTYLLAKSLYLLTCPDSKWEILAVCLPKLYWALFCLAFLLIALIFWLKSFYNKFFLNINGLFDDKLVLFTTNGYGSLVQYL